MSIPFYNFLFNLSLDERGETPIYLQLAASVAEVIRSGKIQPGVPMPGTRTLAKALNISRNAAIAAYGELHDQGWIQTEAGFGTRVALVLPDFHAAAAEPLPRSTHCGFPVPTAALDRPIPPSFRIDWREPASDPRLFPAEALARAFRRPLSRAFTGKSRYADPSSTESERECLAAFLTERRGLALGPDNLLLLNSRQEGLSLVCKALFPPGSGVAVEDPGNPRTWSLLERSGHVPVPIPVDSDGLIPGALEDACISHRPRALVLSPNCHWPTGAILSRERRSAILELAGRYRMAVVEDDWAAELYYEERDWRPLAADDRRGVVIHLGGFEALIGSAFPLGFLSAPSEALACLASAQEEARAESAGLFSGVLRELLLDGTLLRHIRKARTTYRARRDHLHKALRALFPEPVAVGLPPSGQGLWIASAEAELIHWRQRLEGLGLGLPSIATASTLESGVLFPFAGLDEPALQAVLPLLKRVGWAKADKAGPFIVGS